MTPNANEVALVVAHLYGWRRLERHQTWFNPEPCQWEITDQVPALGRQLAVALTVAGLQH